MRCNVRDLGAWLSRNRRWRPLLVLLAAIVMAGGCAPRVCRTTIGAREIPCPLSRSDLGLVTKWIATEVVRARQPFCWRRTYTQRPFKKCRRGYYGRIGICLQRCTSGRKRCGLGCAKSGKSCFKNTAKMILAPLVMAVNIVTYGSASRATAAIQAASRLVKLSKMLRRASRRRGSAGRSGRAGGRDRELRDTIRAWLRDYIADFQRMTTGRVQRELTRRFSGDALLWIQEQYAMNHLTLVMKASGINAAQNTLSTLATFDPSGVAAVVSAFSKPKCPFEKPFPFVRLRPSYAPPGRP